MATCQRNNWGSVVLDRAGGGGNSRIFSGASFRRLVVDALRCGGSCRQIDSIEGPKALVEEPKQRSEKLSGLLNPSKLTEEAEEVRRKVETLEDLKWVAKRLQSDDVLRAAVDVRRLTKENSAARTNLALLGAISPLVALLDSHDLDAQIASLYALLNLEIGNDANKAAIVEAGAVHKMLKLIESPNGFVNSALTEAIVANFLGLSALDSNKPIIGSSGAVPFLVKILKDSDKTISNQVKQDSWRALYNLSISPHNVSFILETNLVPFLLSSLGDMKVSERILSILRNVVASREGREAINIVPHAFPILTDVLNWTDSSGCQEKASYILMVMARKSYGNRQAMVEAGLASSLLELTLLGSTLAQKRASRILECLRVDKGKQVSERASVSAPIYGSSSSSADVNVQLKDCLEENVTSEEWKAVKQLVHQSLQGNMRRMVKRANLPQDFIPSDHLKSLTSSSTSKSLPF